MAQPRANAPSRRPLAGDHNATIRPHHEGRSSNSSKLERPSWREEQPVLSTALRRPSSASSSHRGEMIPPARAVSQPNTSANVFCDVCRCLIPRDSPNHRGHRLLPITPALLREELHRYCINILLRVCHRLQQSSASHNVGSALQPLKDELSLQVDGIADSQLATVQDFEVEKQKLDSYCADLLQQLQTPQMTEKPEVLSQREQDLVAQNQAMRRDIGTLKHKVSVLKDKLKASEEDHKKTAKLLCNAESRLSASEATIREQLEVLQQERNRSQEALKRKEMLSIQQWPPFPLPYRGYRFGKK